MADKENSNFGLSLKDMGLDNIADGGIDKLLADDGDVSAEKKAVAESVNTDADDDFIDFNDFSIDDLDTALSKFGDDENAGEVSVGDDVSLADKNRNNGSENQGSGLSAQIDVSDEKENDKASNTIVAEAPKVSTEFVVDGENSDEYSQDGLDKQTLGNLIWYDGTLGEKVYEISLNNMPEFLDYDSEIKTIHVNIESPYGWNVFFENGVFMNLMDLKEYQERHGNLPGHNGKIIYGSRMSSFEKIDRIVVYSKPRYFAYGLKK